jgi:hypothetical protein
LGGLGRVLKEKELMEAERDAGGVRMKTAKNERGGGR